MWPTRSSSCKTWYSEEVMTGAGPKLQHVKRIYNLDVLAADRGPGFEQHFGRDESSLGTRGEPKKFR